MDELIVFLLIILKFEYISGDIASSTESQLYQPNDPRRCVAQAGAQAREPEIRFEVLPGVGFDNLRNVKAGQVAEWTYRDCKSTDDGRYIIPDAVFVTPVKASSLEIFAEVFEHWSSYNSATSRSINVDVGGGFAGFKISGQYSNEFEKVKTHQVQDKSMTTRVQIRHVFYTAQLQPGAALHPSFKQSLLQIAANLQNNNTAVARYLSQLLVRDYGTHVITSVDAGAALVKEDHVKNTFLEDSDNSKSEISASASASFFSYVHFDVSYKSKDSKSSEQQYTGNLTRSSIRTHGGPSYRSNFTVNMWEEGLDNDLVVIDRAGDPLDFFVTSSALPELPDPTVRDLADLVKSAVELYYKVNTHAGCTKQDAPNFSFTANLDDGSCTHSYTNFTFGGIYQHCTNTAWFGENLCKDLVQTNPKTAGFSCPTGYQSVLLHTGTVTGSKIHTKRICNQVCSRRRWWWGTSCHDNCVNRLYSSSASYSAYWCAAKGDVTQNSGFLFGGLYTSRMANPVTGSTTCPLNFFKLRLGIDLHVCVSDDYELGTKYSLPFAGFFSCVTGNPLSISSTGAAVRSSSGAIGDNKMPLLQQYMMNAGPAVWPKSCPQGFSQHLGVIEGACEIHYCVRLGALSDLGLPKIHRPPFHDKPSENPNSTNTLMIYGVAGKVWEKHDTSGNWVRIDRFVRETPSESAAKTELRANESTSTSDVHLSAGAAAGLGVAATALCGLVLAVVVTRVRAFGAKKRLALDRQSLNVHENENNQGSSYGSVDENAC